MKIRPVGAELFHADGRKDRHQESSGLERRTKLGATKRIKVLDVQKVALGFEENKTLK
jgi:hypothetical protein